MRQVIGRLWLGAALASGALSGCQATGPGYPQDPLLLSKKPVAVRPSTAAPVQVAAHEPTLPTAPALPGEGGPRVVRSAAPEP